MIKLVGIILLLVNCNSDDILIDKSKLLGSDYRLFQNTPAWELSKSVKMEDTSSILAIAKKNPGMVDYREPVYGQTLLKLAVYNHDYNSVKALLESGADPNKRDTHDQVSAFMVAATLDEEGFPPYYSKGSPRYLKLLLRYGGNPNDDIKKEQINPDSTYNTAFLLACRSGILEYVKILVDGGADVNYYNNSAYSALNAATTSKNPYIVTYLLKKGADFKRPLYRNASGENKYLIDELNSWNYKKGSAEHNEVMKILKVLKDNGDK